MLFIADKKHGTFEADWLKSDVQKMLDGDGELLAECQGEYAETLTSMCTPERVGALKTFLGVPLDKGEQVLDTKRLE